MQKRHDLIEKYGRPGPRYTSYPPVPFWVNGPNETGWIEHLKSSYRDVEGVDLYVHVPFCEKLCYYCGCNRIISRNHDIEPAFVETVLKEWEIYKKSLGYAPKVNSLHFGGGTPNFLSPGNLDKLIVGLTEERAGGFLGSIEIDPRTITLAHLDCFKAHGINRISLGIQDFDLEVQRSINRIQSHELVKSVVNEIRKRGIESINFDLIYGLPNQTLETIETTLVLVRDLDPDLISYYSYAHMPDKLVNQKLIKPSELPSAALRQKLYERGRELLVEGHYRDIGMDHFAKPSNFLNVAKEEKRLNRNFMGYVDKKSSVLVGLGPSSISNSSLSFVQNEKNYALYESKINSGQLAIAGGHTHSQMDLETQKIILSLMCDGECEVGPNLPYLDDIIQELNEFKNDGVLRFEGNRIFIQPEGRLFLRNVAMTFDYHFRKINPTNKFSQTI